MNFIFKQRKNILFLYMLFGNAIGIINNYFINICAKIIETALFTVSLFEFLTFLNGLSSNRLKQRLIKFF